MHEFASTDIDAHVIGRRLEKKQIAGLKMINVNRVYRDALLCSRARHTHAHLVIDVPDQTTAIEAVRRGTTVAVGRTDQRSREGGGRGSWRWHDGADHCGAPIGRSRRLSTTGGQEKQKGNNPRAAHAPECSASRDV